MREQVLGHTKYLNNIKIYIVYLCYINILNNILLLGGNQMIR